MKVFVILLVLIGFAGTMLAIEFTQESYAITLGMSSEQILENHQLIILGHVDSVEISSGQTKYTISVLDYIKYPDKFEEKETIKVVGCAEGQIGGCITFDKGQNVLFPLNEKNGIFHISEVSFVAPNPYCTTNDLFALNDANHGLETSQNNQTKQFFTGQPIDITFYAYNKKLDDSSYKVTIEFFRANNNTVFSKTFEGKFEECVPNVNLETSFTPTEMGKYGKRYTASYGGGELLWGFPIIEKGATPLKQFKSSISIDKIQCKDNLVLIQKYDGSPACVNPETKTKLIERGWTVKDSTVSVKGCDTKADFDLVRYSESSDKPPQRLVAFLKEGTTGFICLQYQSNLENKGFFDIDEDMYQRNSKTEISSEVTLNAKPNQVSLEYGTDIMVVYEIRASSNSTGVYWINLSQLCDSLPVVIWNDEPKVSESDIPVRTGVKHCPMKVLDVSITGYSGLDLKYHSAKPT